MSASPPSKSYHAQARPGYLGANLRPFTGVALQMDHSN